jgi:hypothetical protein
LMLPEIVRAVASVSLEPSKETVTSSNEVILTGKSKPTMVRAVKHRGKSRPAFPSLAGRGAYAIRALPDLCLEIVSGCLEFAL